MPGYRLHITTSSNLMPGGLFTNAFDPGAGKIACPYGGAFDSGYIRAYVTSTAGGSLDAPSADKYITFSIKNRDFPQTYTVTMQSTADRIAGDFPGPLWFPYPIYDYTDITVSGYIQSHNITGPAHSHGTVSPDVGTTFFETDTLVFTVTPDAGYRVVSFLVDGVDRGIPSTGGTFNYGSGHTADVNIAATFAPLTQTLHTTVGAHGSMTPANGSTFTPGDPLAFTFTPESTNYRVKTATIDLGAGAVDITTAARTGSYNVASAPGNDVTVVVEFESLLLNVTLRLTATPPNDCPAGQRVVAKAFQSGLIVPGVGLLAIWNDTKQAITETSTAQYNPFISGLMIVIDTGWTGNQVISSSITGATGYTAVADLVIPGSAFTPGTDVVIDVTTSTTRICEPNAGPFVEPETKPKQQPNCPVGSTWNGSACVPNVVKTEDGHDCDTGYYWDETLGACTRIPTGGQPNPCNPGVTHWDPIEGACVPDCTTGYHWDYSTHACVPDGTGETLCQPGYHWNESHTACVRDGGGETTKYGKIHVTAYLEFMPYHMTAYVSQLIVGQTPVTTDDLEVGTYAVQVNDGAGRTGTQLAVVQENATTEVRFDFFTTDESAHNGLRVMAYYNGDYLNVPINLTSPSSSVTSESCPYAADDVATGTWTASTSWRGSTITGSAVVATTGVSTILLVLPGSSDTRLSEEQLLGLENNDSSLGRFIIRWRDQNKNWGKDHEIDLGSASDSECYPHLHRTGRYRIRQYELIYSDPAPLVIAAIDEEVTIPENDNGGGGGGGQ